MATQKADAHLRRAEALFNSKMALSDHGILTEADSAETVKALEGTPWQAAFREIIARQRENGPLAAQPPSVVQGAIQALQADIANHGIDEGKQKRLAQLQKVGDAQQVDIRKDPLRAYVKRHGDPVGPLDTSSPEAFVQSLAIRGQLADLAGNWAQRPVGPLFAEDVEQVREFLDALPAKAGDRALGMVSAVLGPKKAAGMAAQIAPRDKALAIALAIDDTGPASQHARTFVMQGRQAIKDGTSTKGEKEPGIRAANWNARAATTLQGVYPFQPQADMVRDEAVLIMHGMAAEKGGTLTGDDIEAAVKLAAGGELIPRGWPVIKNGRREPGLVPLAPGVTEDMLDARLKNITASEIATKYGPDLVTGTGMVPAEEFARSLKNARLMYAGRGRYNVIVSGRPVLAMDGRRVEITVTAP